MPAKPKPNLSARLAYFEDSGSQTKHYPLMMAVYYDDFEKAKAVLESDPGQLNLQEPYARLTALHVAIFRKNVDIVRLLLSQTEVDLSLKDAFQRRIIDMLDYSINQEVFGLVLDAVYSSELHSLENRDDSQQYSTVVALKPLGQ